MARRNNGSSRGRDNTSPRREGGGRRNDSRAADPPVVIKDEPKAEPEGCLYFLAKWIILAPLLGIVCLIVGLLAFDIVLEGTEAVGRPVVTGFRQGLDKRAPPAHRLPVADTLVRHLTAPSPRILGRGSL